MELAAPARRVLLAPLSDEQPLTTVLAHAHEPGGGGVFPQVLQHLPFGQRHLHGVAAGAVGLPLRVVAPRLIAACQLFRRLDPLEERRARGLGAAGAHGVAGDGGGGQRFPVESLKGFGVSGEVGRGQGLWWGDASQRGWRDAAGGLAAPGFGVAAQHVEGAGAGLRDG